MVLRHTATGRRYEDSVDHESGSAENPEAPWVKTVPEKRKRSGTSPSPSACTYLAPATSKSYVHSTGRSNSMVPSNRPTIDETCVHKNGRSEFPHWGVSPNRS